VKHDCRTGDLDYLGQHRPEQRALAGSTGLARRYPGAHVLGTYPISPVLTTTGLNTATAITSFHFDPSAGRLQVTVTPRRMMGGRRSKFSQYVALYESTRIDMVYLYYLANGFLALLWLLVTISCWRCWFPWPG
jgi:hypothetical protein